MTSTPLGGEIVWVETFLPHYWPGVHATEEVDAYIVRCFASWRADLERAGYRAVGVPMLTMNEHGERGSYKIEGGVVSAEAQQP